MGSEIGDGTQEARDPRALELEIETGQQLEKGESNAKPPPHAVWGGRRGRVRPLETDCGSADEPVDSESRKLDCRLEGASLI